MIELRFLPGLFVMASLAFLSFLRFVLVVLLVARKTIRLQLVLVQIPLVTAHALRVAMLAPQGVLGLLVVIEGHFFPAFRIVASLALGAEFTLVPFFLVVVFLVTGIAVHLQLVFVQIALVAV